MIPRIRLIDELPQWIISSDLACYCPRTDTIWCRRDKWWLVFHELGHWLACKISWEWLHGWLDGGTANYK